MIFPVRGATFSARESRESYIKYAKLKALQNFYE